MPIRPPALLPAGSEQARALTLAVVVAAAMAGLLTLASATMPFRVLDGLWFDAAASRTAARPPKVILIEQDDAFRALGPKRYAALIAEAENVGLAAIGFPQRPDGLPDDLTPRNLPIVMGASLTRDATGGGWHWSDENASDNSAEPFRMAASMIAPAEYGLYRAQHAALPTAEGRIASFEQALIKKPLASGVFYPRMARDQNIPEARASQLLAGHFSAARLDGMIAIVRPDASQRERRFATALQPTDGGMLASDLSARMVQSLLDDRAAYRMQPLWVFATLLAIALAVPLVLARSDAKRAALPTIVLGTLLIVLIAWSILAVFSLIAPLSAMLVTLFLAVVTFILFQEFRADRALRRILDRAVDYTHQRSILNEKANLPQYLTAAAKSLGFPASAVLEPGENGKAAYRDGFGFTAEDVSFEPAIRETLPPSDITGTVRPIATAKEGDKIGQRFLARIGTADRPGWWLFDLTPQQAKERAGELLDQVGRIAAVYARLDLWRSDLATNEEDGRVRPLEQRIGSAASLIETQSEQLRSGIDQLDTAVAIYHFGGFPVHANSAMERLYGEAELNLSRATLEQALVGLTALEEEAAGQLIGELVRQRRPITVPAREFAARQRILRIAALREEAMGNNDLIVVEALDISELNRLANLRHAVGNFIDKQLRNDLEALEFGTDVAMAQAGAEPALVRTLERLRDVSRRAVGRLEHVADLIDDTKGAIIDVCYPIDARRVVEDAYRRVKPKADDFEVAVELDLPGIGGFTMAEPLALLETVEAMMAVAIADTPHGGTIRVSLREERDTSRLEISGGFGIPFERLVAAFDEERGDVPQEFATIARGIARAVSWKGQVSYWSSVGKGYRFVVKLKRVG